MASALLSSAATGAALELLFGSFLKAVLQVRKDCAMFTSILETLEKTLRSLSPVVKTIDSFNRDFDRPQEISGLRDLLQKGDNLVRQCSKIHRYNIIKKPYYAKKLAKLEESLRRYIDMDLAVHHYADSKETLFEVKQQSNQIKQLSYKISQLSMGSDDGSFQKGGFGLAGVCSPPELKVNPVGLEVPLMELKKKLLQEDVPLIVVSAPVGYGKTTLVTTLCQDLEVRGQFKNNIFFLTVSKRPNLIFIVQRLFQHKGREAPQLRSDEDAITQLECLPKKPGPDPILLVLDDVKSGSEFLLEKLMSRIKDFKILVTSRCEFPTFGSTYILQTLNEADAMILFYQSAFPRDGNFYVPDQDDVNELVKSLKGIPVAISEVGKSLCRKPAAEWRKKLKECCKMWMPRMINLQSRNVSCIYVPEDHKIPATVWIDMWEESRKLDEDEAIAISTSFPIRLQLFLRL